MTDDTASENICPECHRTFKTAAALREHGRTHRVVHEPLPTPRFDHVPEHEVLGHHHTTPTGAVPEMSAHEERAPEVTVKVKKLRHYGNLPDLKRATTGSAGIDLYAAISEEIAIAINHWVLVPTGLAIEVPPGWVAKIVPRSGLAANSGITILNTPGIIDSDYRGEIKINLINNTTSKFRVLPGMRIAQMLLERSPVVHLEYVDELSQTARGSGGFGSTGS